MDTKDQEFEYFDLLNQTKLFNEQISTSNSDLSAAVATIDTLLEVMKSSFEEAKISRAKHRFLPLYAESISKLIDSKNRIRKDQAILSEKRLSNNLKLRAIHEIEKPKDGETAVDASELLNRYDEMFKT